MIFTDWMKNIKSVTLTDFIYVAEGLMLLSILKSFFESRYLIIDAYYIINYMHTSFILTSIFLYTNTLTYSRCNLFERNESNGVSCGNFHNADTTKGVYIYNVINILAISQPLPHFRLHTLSFLVIIPLGKNKLKARIKFSIFKINTFFYNIK